MKRKENKPALQWFVEYDFYLKDLKENKRFMDLGPTMAKWHGGGVGIIFFQNLVKIDQKIFYWSPAFRICMGCLPKYERNLLEIGFENTYFQVFQGFPAQRLLHTSSKMANFGQFLAKMGKTGFFQKSVWNIFFAVQSLN